MSCWGFKKRESTKEETPEELEKKFKEQKDWMISEILTWECTDSKRREMLEFANAGKTFKELRPLTVYLKLAPDFCIGKWEAPKKKKKKNNNNNNNHQNVVAVVSE